MKRIPSKLNMEINQDPFYSKCARRGLHGHTCAGRITREHAVIYAGKQVQTRWAIIPLCAKAHSVDEWQDRGDLNKEINLWIALSRASESELQAASRAVNYSRERDRLSRKYGRFEMPVSIASYPSVLAAFGF